MAAWQLLYRGSLLSRRSITTLPQALPYGRRVIHTDSQRLEAGHGPGKHLKKTTASQAEDYNTSAHIQQEDGENLISLIKKFSPKKANGVILDLGCGTGNLTPLLSEFAGEGGRVIGVDPDEERLKVARVKFEGKLSNVEFLKGTGEDFPEESYDLVFSNYVMHWIKDKPPVFKKVHNNIEAGGIFAFLAPIEEPFFFETAELLQPGFKQLFTENVHLFSPEGYDKLAASQGFMTMYRDVYRRENCFPNIDSIVKWWSGSTHGKFDPDKAKVEQWKKKYGDKPFDAPYMYTIASFILTKP